MNILFIGGSITRDGDIPDKVGQRLAQAGLPGTVAQETFSRATLEQHWNRLETQQRMFERDWDAVVLQEQGLRPLNEPDLMRRYLALWAAQIRAAGAKPVLFLPWRRVEHRHDDGAWAAICDQHYACARSLDMTVAPVGRAWEAVQAQQPWLELNAQGNHANESGAHLAAAVLAAAIAGDAAPIHGDLGSGELIADFWDSPAS